MYRFGLFITKITQIRPDQARSLGHLVLARCNQNASRNICVNKKIDVIRWAFQKPINLIGDKRVGKFPSVVILGVIKMYHL